MTTTQQSPFLLIDKPSGMTSHDVVNRIRRRTGVKRVGHAGTLDPLATGLLIVLVGRESTKKQAEFLHMDKVYECTGQLGITTDTYDREGRVVHEAPWENVQAISQQDIEHVLEKFRGEIQQQVPAFSAVKMQGRKLYELARKDRVETLELPTRTVQIHALELLDVQKDDQAHTYSFSLRVHSSSGTYIRSLVHDIGQTLGVGATVTALRRISIGPYTVATAEKLV